VKLLEVIGWTGNALYFSRFLVQWWASEKAKRSVAPRVFWWISLIATFCAGAYTTHIGEPVLLIGIAANAAIYARNIWIAYHPGGRPLPLLPLVGLAILGTATLFWAGLLKARGDWNESLVWLVVVITGQALWSSRFVVQWWATERRRESHFPLAFWWLSLGGNSLLLAYALHLRDPIVIAGLTVGPFVQVRNLMLNLRRPAHAT